MLNDNIIFISAIIVLILAGILFLYKNELDKIYEECKEIEQQILIQQKDISNIELTLIEKIIHL